MKIVTVTDAWHPQVNGVVRTIDATNRELEKAGHTVAVIAPDQFSAFRCPGYPEIQLSIFPYGRLADLLDRHIASWEATAIHIATEGPLGRAARRYCVARNLPFTTAYHTRFPQYLRAMFGVPERWTYSVLRRFHGDASCVMAPTQTVEAELRSNGIGNIGRWTRGVDLDMFQPREPMLRDLPRPLLLYVGRVSVEKNIGAFLTLDLPGTKIVAGVGPELEVLKRRFPEVRFLGVLEPGDLARLYSSADVFVFPSLTDTFGLVMLEALACGTPVAAFPVQGPIDVVGGSGVAVLDHDLQKAVLLAQRIDREECRKYAQRFSWRAATQQFLRLQQAVTAVPAGRMASRRA